MQIQTSQTVITRYTPVVANLGFFGKRYRWYTGYG